jgi:DNA polymerase III subunit chi
MTEVWFYVSEDDSQAAPGKLLLRLIERARQARRQLYLHTDDEAACHRLDHWLWQDGFVPHGMASEPQVERQPVVIGFGPPPSACRDMMVNLSSQPAQGINDFNRLIELVAGDQGRRLNGRERWKYYRDQGYPVTKHELP